MQGFYTRLAKALTLKTLPVNYARRARIAKNLLVTLFDDKGQIDIFCETYEAANSLADAWLNGKISFVEAKKLGESHAH